MARKAPQRRTSTAAAVLVGMLLLAVPATTTTAHAGDRPPPHAGSGETPPGHAHAAAPEDRPPAHARARRASTRPDARARSGHRATSSAPPGSQGPSGGARSAPPPHAAVTNAPRADRPGADAPAHGRPGHDPDPGEDARTELDTDVVVEGAAPTPDRAPANAGAPVLSTSPPVAVVASPLLGVSPSTPFSGGGPAPDATDTGTDGVADGAADGAGTNAGPDADAGSAPDRLAAPRTRSVPPRFGAPELTRRVVVPVVVLVAGLVYLLAQGRIDRRGELLLAPLEPGTEGDDEVFPL